MVVIILRVAIAELRRGNDVIELANGTNRRQAIELVTLREELLFSRIARHQAVHKAPLVEIVVHALERVGTRSKVEGRTNPADTTQLLRHVRAKLSGHLGHQVSTHRVAGEEDLFETVVV